MALVSHGGDVFAAARRQGVAVSGILDFSASINPLGLSPKARRRIKRELSLVCHYPDKCQAELRNVVASRERIKPDCLLFGNGATQLIHLISRCLRPKKALVAEPSFAEYRAALRCSGSKIVEFRMRVDRGFRFETDEFLEALEREQPELIILGNPNNPTGSVIPRKSLLRLASFCADRRMHLLIDESFIDFTCEASLLPLAVRQQFLIVVRSFTKFFALPGLRIGYLAAHRTVIERLGAYLEPWSVNALALVAAAESMKDSAYREKTLALIKRGKQYLSDALAKLGWLEPYPSEANFLLLRITAQGLEGSDLRQKLEAENILIRDATGFRGLSSQHVRIAIRRRRENRLLLDALHAIDPHFQSRGRT